MREREITEEEKGSLDVGGRTGERGEGMEEGFDRRGKEEKDREEGVAQERGVGGGGGSPRRALPRAAKHVTRCLIIESSAHLAQPEVAVGSEAPLCPRPSRPHPPLLVFLCAAPVPFHARSRTPILRLPTPTPSPFL